MKTRIGLAAAAAAALAAQKGVTVQDMPIPELQEILRSRNVVL